VIHLFVKVALKVDEVTNFVFVQLIEQGFGIYMTNATKTMPGGTK
jgi:hypothetical protein